MQLYILVCYSPKTPSSSFSFSSFFFFNTHQNDLPSSSWWQGLKCFVNNDFIPIHLYSNFFPWGLGLTQQADSYPLAHHIGSINDTLYFTCSPQTPLFDRCDTVWSIDPWCHELVREVNDQRFAWHNATSVLSES